MRIAAAAAACLTILLLGACRPHPDSPTPESAPPNTGATAAPTTAPASPTAPPTGLQPEAPTTSGIIAEVVDGDTVVIAFADGTTEKVRLVGLDTPETKDPRKPVQCFGREASRRVAELLDGQAVQFEPDPSDTRDKYGRLLGFVWLSDGRLYNHTMILEGFAHEYTYQGRSYPHQAEFKAAEVAAREAAVGLWSPTTCAGDTTQEADSTPTTTSPTAPAPADVSFPNCAAARAAGRAPLREGEPGYSPRLDGDRDGVACE